MHPIYADRTGGVPARQGRTILSAGREEPFMSSPRYILSFPSFHRFLVQQSVCLCAIGCFHSSRIRCARFLIVVRFCVFQPPLQDGLSTLNAYDIRQVVRSYGGGSGWLRHGSGWLRCLARFLLGEQQMATERKIRHGRNNPQRASLFE